MTLAVVVGMIAGESSERGSCFGQLNMTKRTYLHLMSTAAQQKATHDHAASVGAWSGPRRQEILKFVSAAAGNVSRGELGSGWDEGTAHDATLQGLLQLEQHT